MPRISRLSRSEVAPELRDVYDQFLRDRGNVPYFFRTLAHRPEIFRTATAHMHAVLQTGTLPTRLKELAVVRTSQLNCTAYCLASHTAISLRLGTTPEQIEALKNWRDSPLFSEAEKAAIDLAESMTLHSNEYSDDKLAQLKRFYSAKSSNSSPPSACSTTSIASTTFFRWSPPSLPLPKSSPKPESNPSPLDRLTYGYSSTATLNAVNDSPPRDAQAPTIASWNLPEANRSVNWLGR